MLRKTHEVAMGGGSIGVALVCLALILMSLDEETDWEHFRSFGNMFGCEISFFFYSVKFRFFHTRPNFCFFLLDLYTSFQFWTNFQRKIIPLTNAYGSTYTWKYMVVTIYFLINFFSSIFDKNGWNLETLLLKWKYAEWYILFSFKSSTTFVKVNSLSHHYLF